MNISYLYIIMYLFNMNLSQKDHDEIKRIVDEDRKSMDYLSENGSPVTRKFATAFIIVADGKI